MAYSGRTPTGLWFMALAACIVVAVCLATGCTSFFQAKTGDFGAATKNASGSTSDGSGGTNGGGNGPHSGTGTNGKSASDKSGSTGSGSASMAKAVFRIACSLTRVHDNGDTVDTTTVKFNQEVPFVTDADPITLASEDPYMDYESMSDDGYGTKLPINVQWDHTCKQGGSGSCLEFHYVYDGPIWIDGMLSHTAGHAPNDWSVQFSDVTTTSALDATGKPDRYSTFKGGSPTPDMKSMMTTIATTEANTCWDGAGGAHPVTYGDGSQITYNTDDPEVTLDSAAVMHFGIAT